MDKILRRDLRPLMLRGDDRFAFGLFRITAVRGRAHVPGEFVNSPTRVRQLQRSDGGDITQCPSEQHRPDSSRSLTSLPALPALRSGAAVGGLLVTDAIILPYFQTIFYRLSVIGLPLTARAQGPAGGLEIQGTQA